MKWDHVRFLTKGKMYLHNKERKLKDVLSGLNPIFVMTPIKAQVCSTRWFFLLSVVMNKAQRTSIHSGAFKETLKITLASTLVPWHFTWDLTPHRQVLSVKIIWACFYRVQTLGEMPKLSVLPSNISQFWASPRCQRLGWTTLLLVCHPDLGQVTNHWEAIQDHLMFH